MIIPRFEIIKLSLSRSLIPKVISDDCILSFADNNNSVVSTYILVLISMDIVVMQQRYLTKKTNSVADIKSSSRISKPNRKLDKSLIKNSMSNNGEFFIHLDSAVQKNINQFFT